MPQFTPFPPTHFTPLCLYVLLSQSLPLLASPSGPPSFQPPVEEVNSARVVGGRPAVPGEFPFLVALLKSGSAATAKKHQFCGGSLLSAGWVLTAGHCCESGKQIWVAAGFVKFSSLSNRDIHIVSQVFIHPGYKRRGAIVWNDYCLLKLKTGFQTSPFIQTARLGLGFSPTIPQSATVVGWGAVFYKSDSNRQFPDKAYTANVPFIPTREATNRLGVAHHSSWVYAGAPGKDSCVGDSGGPLIIQSSTGPLVVGLVSWGLGCNGMGVYATTSQIAGWIGQAQKSPPVGGGISPTSSVQADISNSPSRSPSKGNGGDSTGILLGVGGGALALCAVCAVLGVISLFISSGGSPGFRDIGLGRGPLEGAAPGTDSTAPPPGHPRVPDGATPSLETLYAPVPWTGGEVNLSQATFPSDGPHTPTTPGSGSSRSLLNSGFLNSPPGPTAPLPALMLTEYDRGVPPGPTII